MHIPARTLRTHIENLPGQKRWLSAKDLDRRDRILPAAQSVFAQYGRAAITLANLAAALAMTPSTIRRLFCDLDAMLAEILRRHLAAIADAIGAIPTDAPDRRQQARAAYIEFTRTGFGAPTEAHRLLLRERHTLPTDLAEQIEAIRRSLGHSLAGENGEAALALLDLPTLDPARIEAMLAPLDTPESRAEPQAEPEAEPVAEPVAEAEPAPPPGQKAEPASQTPPAPKPNIGPGWKEPPDHPWYLKRPPPELSPSMLAEWGL